MIAQQHQQIKGGFILIELLIVITIILILTDILFPVFARAREDARRASCLSNLKQIGLPLQSEKEGFYKKIANLSGIGPPYLPR